MEAIINIMDNYNRNAGSEQLLRVKKKRLLEKCAGANEHEAGYQIPKGFWLLGLPIVKHRERI